MIAQCTREELLASANENCAWCGLLYGMLKRGRHVNQGPVSVDKVSLNLYEGGFNPLGSNIFSIELYFSGEFIIVAFFV
jgi:hypothetical protein